MLLLERQLEIRKAILKKDATKIDKITKEELIEYIRNTHTQGSAHLRLINQQI